MKTKVKLILIIIGVAIMINAIVAISLYTYNKSLIVPPKEMEILKDPTATAILVNQPLSNSTLIGSFDRPGILYFSNPNLFFTVHGIYSVEWEYEIDKNYVMSTSKIKGQVQIEVFQYKLSFETYGGSEVLIQSTGQLLSDYEEKKDDIYFNDSYTLNKTPWNDHVGINLVSHKSLGLMVVKNEYRFDGWSLDENVINILDYPITVVKNETLYAQYTYHTGEKLEYDGPFVSARYENKAQKSDAQFQKMPYEFSIEGEIIIADMIENTIVTSGDVFSGTNITSVRFNNYISSSGDFIGCLNLTEFNIPPTISFIDCLSYSGIRELFIPNTVSALTYIDHCPNLFRVEYEEGDKLLGIPYASQRLISGKFHHCENLKEVILGRLILIDDAFLAYTAIERIVIPATVQEIGYGAFKGCTLLKEVIFLGDNLNYIYPEAFDGCVTLSDITIRGDKLTSIEQFSFRGCISLKEITFPSLTRIDPLAFYGTNISKIGISDNQIQGIVNILHEMYIGPTTDFDNKLIINCYRNIQYDGLNIEGEYIGGSHFINLYFWQFSTQVLDAVVHEFCHYYQYILMYGLEDKTLETIKKVGGLKYDYPRNLSQSTYPDPEVYSLTYTINPAIVFILEIGEPPTFGWGQQHLWETFDELREYLIMSEFFGYAKYGPWAILNEDSFNLWRDNYVALLPDLSNWEEYWNQPLERDARYFASIFSGSEYLYSE